MNQIESELLDLCINNARMLFKEMEGEFYPFGCVYTKERKTAIYYNDNHEEYPTSVDLLNALILTLYFDIKNNKYIGAATCALATKKINENTYEYLDVRIITNDGNQKDYCIIIYPNNIDYTFETEDPLDFIGTFTEVALKLIR